MKRGDKRYRYQNGEMVAVTFLEETIVEGASLPTWLMRDDWGKYRTSKGADYATPLEAYDAWLAEAERSILLMQEHVTQLQQQIAEVAAQVAEIKALKVQNA